MPDEQFHKIAKLFDGEICGERGLLAFLAYDTDAHVGGLNHGYIVTSVTDTAYTLLGVVTDEVCDICFLRWRAPTSYHGGELHCYGDEFLSVVS
jgi:hypothetical protein